MTRSRATFQLVLCVFGKDLLVLRNGGLLSRTSIGILHLEPYSKFIDYTHRLHAAVAMIAMYRFDSLHIIHIIVTYVMFYEVCTWVCHSLSDRGYIRNPFRFMG